MDKARIEPFIAIGADGRATVYVGKVDLGNGSRTALAQLAADELDLPFDRITMLMADTATTSDQWLTGASTTIALGGMELRRACATARAALLARGAAQLGVALRRCSRLTTAPRRRSTASCAPCARATLSRCWPRPNGPMHRWAPAALLALLAHQPVRVQWMRDDEMARSPKSPPRSIDLEAGLDQRGDIVAWQGATSGSR